MTNEILSKENANVKYAKKLASSSKFRKEENCFLIEGARLCKDAFQSGVRIEKIFYTQKCFEKSEDFISKITKFAKKSFVVSQNVMNAISDTNAPQGIVCVCKHTDKSIHDSDVSKYSSVVLLENIQNPSNLGSIFRTCDALGINLVAVSKNSCDIYNPKTLRGSMGALFRLNVILFSDSSEFIKILQKNNFKVYATVPASGSLLLGTLKFEGKTGIVFGNEGNGLDSETINACNEKIMIPMNANAESLNVSVATGIALWEMTNRGKNIDG